jgi:hypothetical protein
MDLRESGEVWPTGKSLFAVSAKGVWRGPVRERESLACRLLAAEQIMERLNLHSARRLRLDENEIWRGVEDARLEQTPTPNANK